MNATSTPIAKRMIQLEEESTTLLDEIAGCFLALKDADAEDLHWGDIGTAAEAVSRLKELRDFLTNGGD